MATIYDYGIATDPLSAPSLPEWATAVAAAIDQPRIVACEIATTVELPAGFGQVNIGAAIVEAPDVGTVSATGITVARTGLYRISATVVIAPAMTGSIFLCPGVDNTPDGDQNMMAEATGASIIAVLGGSIVRTATAGQTVNLYMWSETAGATADGAGGQFSMEWMQS